MYPKILRCRSRVAGLRDIGVDTRRKILFVLAVKPPELVFEREWLFPHVHLVQLAGDIRARITVGSRKLSPQSRSERGD